MKRRSLAPLVGAATVLVIALLFVTVGVLFRGGMTPSVGVTVLAKRAGLVLNPDARVKLRGVQVGSVASLENLPDGRAALHLAMDPDRISEIPANVEVHIASTTVFGAKFIQLVDPAEPSTRTMYAGQVLDAGHVTVEIDTVFQRLTAVLDEIDPAELNATLSAMANALNGRGHRMGQMLADLDGYLAALDPQLPALSDILATAPGVLTGYADAAPDLITTADNAARISRTVVDQRGQLDAALISAIGLAETGNDLLTANRAALTDVAHLLVPTTDLTNRYHEALYCLGAGLVKSAYLPPPQVPGALVNAGFTWGKERFRYPGDLPRVAATGGPQCVAGLPNVPYEARPPFVVADVGWNPGRYGNQGLLVNSDALKNMLFGPLDGPPRNTAQVGQPG
ncbi:virulence factor Mce family protein [Mycolicibacterium insubricum]|uniref:MCE-family protein n=1 Tax=Mycolicibacterium insubricum TaxID=444597 RepID=A0A1X0DFL4_9MYCO|nr:MCE family protein [Mycolicibacterium insubricum]MCB9438804.1 MCE family protein [Mycolicibacterium sp.]MCV7083342.1 MCE family protein [Mycolicibacterium insubricum]ORA71181.1 MCE-family protein [Mycolicibacterium insubricum]BBZ68758.1 virulence factor Mce family protein [Mycolicibacterium insubricum]